MSTLVLNRYELVSLLLQCPRLMLYMVRDTFSSNFYLLSIQPILLLKS